MISEAYVTIVLPGHTRPTTAGRLTIDQMGQDIQANFVYGRNYCNHPDAISLDPLRLPLDPTQRFESSGLWGTLGVFRDASPDYWGRLIIERHNGTTELPEIEYLLRAGPTRVGALGFQSTLDAEPATETPPEILSLQALLKASAQIEADEPVDEAMLHLLRQGTSIGGARPKATILDDGNYWLAKFPSQNDRSDQPAIEYATLQLAADAGINVPECKLITLEDGQRVMLSRRFDRIPASESWHRTHYMSGLTLLGLHDTENSRGSYPELADVLRRLSGNFPTDGEELFRRMIFNILISNDDDHLRNHAVIYKPDGWRLSPVYDLVPHPQIGYDRFQSINVGDEGRTASIANALTAHQRFGLNDHRAQTIINEVRAAIEPWQDRYRDLGVSVQDIDRIQTAFLPESTLQKQ